MVIRVSKGESAGNVTCPRYKNGNLVCPDSSHITNIIEALRLRYKAEGKHDIEGDFVGMKEEGEEREVGWGAKLPF